MDLAAFNNMLPTCENIARWIIRTEESKTSISLLFIEQENKAQRKAKLEAICLRLQRAFCTELYQNEMVIPQKFQIQYGINGNLLGIPQQVQDSSQYYYIYLIDISDDKIWERCNPLLEKNIRLNAIIWKQSNEPLALKKWAEWEKLFHRFAVFQSPKIEDLGPIYKLLAELGSVLKPQEISYLLKGWPKTELKSKGLLCHQAFAQLASWDIETIDRLIATCQQEGQISFWLDSL